MQPSSHIKARLVGICLCHQCWVMGTISKAIGGQWNLETELPIGAIVKCCLSLSTEHILKFTHEISKHKGL